MAVEIIASIIACAGTVAGSFFGVLASNRLTAYRIKKLEEKVDRVFRLERQGAGVEEEIKVVNHRIKDLECYHK